MKKEEILKSYKNEQHDEGKDYVDQQSDTNGFYAILALASILTLYKIRLGLPYGDTGSIPLIYIAFFSFKNYQLNKDKEMLKYGIVTGMIGIAFLVWYVIGTL